MTPRPTRPRILRWGDDNPLVPYLYLLPHAALFLVFVVYPIGFGLYVSVHDWNILSDRQPFAGLAYYRNLFEPGTPQATFFWRSLLNTSLFVVLSVPLIIASALGLALLLDRPIVGRNLFRTIFFLPTILAVSIMGLLWRWMFENRSGLVNLLLESVPLLRPVPFLTSVGWAWLPIVLGTIWWTVGFNMILYSAALSGIPRTYFEAAELDGAGPLARFRFITWPMLSPVTLFAAVTTTIASFQLFGQSYVITSGGPLRTTQSVMMYITEEAFTNYRFSSAAAMSMLFGAILLLVTAFQFRMTIRDLGRGNA